MMNNKRFIVEEEIIKDTKTGITWQRDLQKYGEMNFDEALDLAEKENKTLPTREYWQSLNNGEYPDIKLLREIGFKNIEIYYWTYDEYNISNAWVVSFSLGYDFYGAKTNINCVTLLKKMEKLIYKEKMEKLKYKEKMEKLKYKERRVNHNLESNRFVFYKDDVKQAITKLKKEISNNAIDVYAKKENKLYISGSIDAYQSILFKIKEIIGDL